MLKLVLALALLLSGCGPTIPATYGAAAAAPAPSGTALAALATLPAGTAHPLTGAYTRAAFLPHGWADGDGCDARRDALARQAVADVVRSGGCVLSATVLDPYSGKRISSRGANAVDADHVVPLAEAWVDGADAWPAAMRVAFGHDPLNLIATGAGLNRSKGDKSADQWLPPLISYQCSYVARQIAVKIKYKLLATTPEHAAMARVLNTCPRQTLPTGPETETP